MSYSTRIDAALRGLDVELIGEDGPEAIAFIVALCDQAGLSAGQSGRVAAILEEARLATALEVLADCAASLREVMVGELCDHDTGICWCAEFLALGRAEALVGTGDSEVSR